MSKTLELDKQDSKVGYVGAGWTGLAGGSEIDDQSITLINGAGTIDKAMANQTGSSAVNLQNGVHFQYDKRLDASTTEDAVDGFGSTAGGIIDTGASGALSKKIRLVENTANIKSGTNYTALKVYAKNLSALVSPPSDRAYVDPTSGKFVLPRPIYWSKAETDANLITAEIAQYTPTKSGVFSIYPLAPYGLPVKFSGFCPGGRNNVIYSLNPIGANTLSKGAMSIWFLLSSDDGYPNNIYAYLTNEYNWGLYKSSDNGYYSYPSLVALGVGNRTWVHVYIIWDVAKSITGGFSYKIFYNGVLRESSTSTITAITPKINFALSAYQDNYCFDNVKVWDHIVSEYPSWEYNAGSGREDALHSIYGTTNGYKPSGVKASYFYLSTSTSAAIMAKPGANAEVQLENASNVLNGAATFGLSTVMRKSDYNQLVAGVDYVYDSLLSSGTYDIYDDSASGAFAVGKYMRLVEGTKNITDVTGLGLTVRAKDLSTIISPPSTEAYIDPARAIFVLPRPIYWSDCLDENSFKTNAKIKHGTITTAGTWYYGAGSVVFGKGFGTNVQYDYGAYGEFSVSNIPGALTNLSKFTCSFHANVFAGWHNSGTYTTFGFGVAIGNVYIGMVPSDVYHASTHYIDVYVNGSLETRYGPYADATPQHICVIGDSSAGLSGSKTVKVYLDGSLLHQSTTVFNNTSVTMSIGTNGACYWNYVGAYSLIGNVKLYDHAIDQTPTWISATEDALHYMYGATNGYKPALTAPGGVGYYKAGGSGNYVSWKTLTEY